MLSNGTVYLAFGSHADYGLWHGWVIGYDAADLQQQTGVYNSTPDGYGGSVWQSGRGVAADSSGALYFISGNGDCDGLTELGQSIIRLDGRVFLPLD